MAGQLARRPRRALVAVAAIAGILGAVLYGRALFAGDSHSCGLGDGHDALEVSALGTEGLTVVEGCTDTYRSLRPGERRVVVLRGDQASIIEALRTGGIDPELGSSTGYPPSEALDSFDVGFTPFGAEWQQGEALSFHDRIDHRGRSWERRVAWGRELMGDGFMLLVDLERGSM
jgi:hypothetical protein